MKTIKTRFVMLIVTAAVAPLLVYGFVSVGSLQDATRGSVTSGNLNVATRAAEQVHLYLSTSINVLSTVGADLQQTYLQPWQQDRILKNYVLQFPQFREITVFDTSGLVVATSRVGAPRVRVPGPAASDAEGAYLSPISVDDDLLPTTTVALQLHGSGRVTGWLVGEVSLEELWRMVDRIRVGERGFTLVVTADGQLVADGDPDGKRRVARGENLLNHPLVRRVQAASDAAPISTEYTNDRGEQILAVAADIPSLRWTVMVEQPTAEAYAVANRLARLLFIAIALALAATLLAGYYWGRSFIRPFAALMNGTRAVAAGQLDEPVRISGHDEFAQLGDAFNRMATRLKELQEDVRRQERQAMFGRIAVGLVHDLSHPIQNIGNSCKLILKMFDDKEYRETFRRTVEREFPAIKRVLEDLRNLARPIPLERFPVDVNRSLTDVIDSMRPHAERAGLTIETRLSPYALFVQGDLFALGRVYRNLILNAIQATAPGGTITVTTVRREGRIEVAVADTGCGIAADRLGAIFDDFVTTKRRGLGLGLAISRKIVEQLSGTISVTSEVGNGTTFVLAFPETQARPVPAVAAS